MTCISFYDDDISLSQVKFCWGPSFTSRCIGALNLSAGLMLVPVCDQWTGWVWSRCVCAAAALKPLWDPHVFTCLNLSSDSREVTGRCQSVIGVTSTTYRPPAPEAACSQGWYPQRNRSGGSCWGNQDSKHLSFPRWMSFNKDRIFSFSPELKCAQRFELDSKVNSLSNLWQIFSQTPELCCGAENTRCRNVWQNQVFSVLDEVWYSVGTRSECSPQRWEKWSRSAAAQAPPQPGRTRPCRTLWLMSLQH